MAGWKVPGYTELGALGGGGFGEVVLARHNATKTAVAIKYLRAELLTDREFARLFRAEAAVLAELNNENVVRLYEYVESENGAAIVMELVEGVCLREILAQQGSTTAEAALVVLLGSLLGLAAAHQGGVVHRDYKPENVLVSGDGASKLTDFGIAARSGERAIPAGTSRYAAPEQLDGSPATPASDVYAATATFYECLTGGPPFTGNTAELLRRHRYEPAPLDLVPVALQPLISAGLAKDPRSRPATALELVTSLNLIVSGAYGSDWVARGRSHLGEASLALAALWPAGSAPAVGGDAMYRIFLRRHATAAKVVAASVVVGTVAAGGIALATTGNGRPGTPVVPVRSVTLAGSLSSGSPSPAVSLSPTVSPSTASSPTAAMPPPASSAPPASASSSASASPSHSASSSPTASSSPSASSSASPTATPSPNPG